MELNEDAQLFKTVGTFSSRIKENEFSASMPHVLS